MNKPGFSRRSFLKRMTAGTISVTLAPAWSCKQEKPASDEWTGQDSALLPKFFDCNKYIGPDNSDRPDFPGIADLLAHLDRLGIDRAVAWHTAARNPSPMKGNSRLLREIDSLCAHDRIIPSFIIDPTMVNDSDVKDSFLELIKKKHIRAFHYFPKEHGWTLRDIVPVLKLILSYKPVLFLDAFENLGDTDEIINISGEFPQVSFVFTHAMWSHNERLYKLMEARSNIYIDTSFMHMYRTIEYITKQFGPERLIFGTGYKSNNGASIPSLIHSGISPGHINAIAHSNLEKLMEVDSPLSGSNPVVGNRLWHKLLRQEPLGVDIIDAHTHLSRRTGEWTDHNPEDIDSHAKRSIRSMDSMGIRTMIIAEISIYDPDLTIGKTYLEKHLEPYGDRFHSYFCGLIVKSMEPDKLIPRLDDLFSRSFYVGFKMLNSYWEIPVTDPSFVPIWEYADAHRLPILLHTWNDEFDAPKMLTDIVPRYPNATFILAHSGHTLRSDAEQLALDNPNVYLEWCGSFMETTDWRETLDRLGNRRLVYGTDFISWGEIWGHDPVWEMGRLLSLDVPDETLIPILGTNMKNILASKI
jgi:predicted TIM-barrel fold metal-dependent hydrolase